MLHELLLALVGCQGDIFVLTEEEQGAEVLADGLRSSLALNGECPFQLSNDLKFVQEPERGALNRFVRLGYVYHRLLVFTQSCGGFSSDVNGEVASSDAPSPGRSDGCQSLFWRALALGISEILGLYRGVVLRLERELLSEEVPLLATAVRAMSEFDAILPPLHALLQQVMAEDVRGGRILSLLHVKEQCGVPSLQACLERLSWHCHQVMYRHLAAWMMYGLLHDVHHEFFIGSHMEDGEDKGAASGATATEAAAQDWHRGFCVRMDMLPSFISLATAESVLFVGKAIRVLRSPLLAQGAKALAHTGPSPVLTPPSVKGPLMAGLLPLRRSSVGKQRAQLAAGAGELLPQEEVNTIARGLRSLGQSPVFDRLAFERVVENARGIAAVNLWKLVVDHANLLGHLHALKDYFLLAKGDLWQCFLEDSRAMMRLPPRRASAEADLNLAFQAAALRACAEDDQLLPRVRIRLFAVQPEAGGGSTSADGGAGMTPLDGWDTLGADYEIDWPLHLIITPDSLAKYNRVFRYLLRLKRTQLELEKTWALAMYKDRLDCRGAKFEPAAQQRRQQRGAMWRVRQHMTCLITNLQFYIQVDVIESQYKLFQERLQASKDFSELVHFHNQYLSALISQSFLDIGSVSRILDTINKLCLRLCYLTEQGDGTPNPSELEVVAEEFSRKSNSLYTILRSTKLAGSQRAPFLRQFLVRLNYNSYFEATARGALSIGRKKHVPLGLPQTGATAPGMA